MPDLTHPTARSTGTPQPPPPGPFPGLPEPVRPACLRIVVADDNPVVRAGLTALLTGRDDMTVVAEAADGREACEAALEHRPDIVLLDVRMPGVDGLSALPYLVRIAPVMMLTYSGESETVREALRRGAGGYLVHGEFTADQLAAAVRDIGRGRPHFTPTAAQALLAQIRGETGPGEQRPAPPGSATAHGNNSPSAAADSTELDGSGGEPAKAPTHSPELPTHPLSHMQPSVGQSTSGAPAYRLSTREAEIMDLIAYGMTNQQIAATCFISEKTVKNHINRIFAKLHSTSRAEAAAKWLGTVPGSRRGRE
ncbi:response regulator [Streptomyces cyaneogriseus]|uniref:response regulator n=1 Tax=Streptomyces cyaneogriseus TaxID=68192 RepID=UPI0005C7EEA1|nr:response regulator transcription factor [Streptomyces cyaneogriseus]